MPGRRAKSRAIGPWVDLLDLPPPPRHKKKRSKHRKRLHPSFKVFLALGLMPSKARQCDPLALRINDTMHIMEDDCDDGRGLLTGERAPNLLERTSESEDSKTAISEESAAESVFVEHVVESTVVEDSTALALTNGKHSKSSIEEEVEEASTKQLNDIEAASEADLAEKHLLKCKDDEKKTEEELGTQENCALPLLVPGVYKAFEDDQKSDLPVTASQLSQRSSKSSPFTEPSGSRTPLGDNFKDSSQSGGSRSMSPSSRPCSPKSNFPQPSCSSKEESPVSLLIKPQSPLSKSNPATSNRKSSSPSSTPKGSPFHVIKEEPPLSIDLNSRNGSSTVSFLPNSENPSRKRVVDKDADGELSSEGDSDSGRKKIKLEVDESTQPGGHQDHQNYMDYERERLIQDFVSECAQRPEELHRASDKLHKEVETLGELLKAKEMEWNTLLRLKMLKEETLERLLRRKRQLLTEGTTVNDSFLDHSALKSTLKNQLMMVPIVSSSPSVLLNRAPPPMRMQEYTKLQHRPLLPKPFPAGAVDTSNAAREGRNGPVLDVKSIIADYRSRNPQDIPRRGRRVRGDPSSRSPTVNPSSLISMSNMALGSGARVRTVNESSYALPTAEQLKSCSAECRDDNSGAGGYKDVLAQFAKLTGQSANHSAGNTKQPAFQFFTDFGSPPHCAGPIRSSSTPAPYRPQPSSRVTINDIINSSKKSRNEITITPVPGTQPSKVSKAEPEDDDGESGDRLVIDESADDSPLQCQGCKQKSAQFVCAGCGNQWYCSRECQVTAWEEHSEICSG